MVTVGEAHFNFSNNCTCSLTPHVSNIFGAQLCNASLLGAWILAVIIGIFIGGRALLSLKPSAIGSRAYAISFSAYALMITSGFVVHSVFRVECGVQKPNYAFEQFLRIDASLTSCIAISFLFNGLIDLQWISEKAWSTIFTMTITYTSLFFAYFCFGIEIWSILYFYSIEIGCGVYVILQGLRIYKEQLWIESIYLVIAGIFGGGSLYAIKYLHCWMACHLGAWSLEGVWYYGSDISVFFVFLFVWYTRTKFDVDSAKEMI